MKLTFTSEALANAALAQINTNYDYYASYEVDEEGEPIANEDGLVGVNAGTGKLVPDAQRTTSWDKVRKAYELDKWFFSKPAVDKMTDVADYSEEEFNEDWNEPVEE